MKTKFKTLTEEPEYKILKNRNFRNNQNYIRLNKSITHFKETFDLFELYILRKISGIFLLFIILLFLFINFHDPFLYLYIIIPLFLLLSYIKEMITYPRRKKLYSSIKISYNSDYYLIIKKIGGKIVKNFYK